MPKIKKSTLVESAKNRKRVPKCYMVNPEFNDKMREFAINNRYALCECVDVAFKEFLMARSVELEQQEELEADGVA